MLSFRKRIKSFSWLFADLLVVVLGILIAFQVEEFRSARSDRIVEEINFRAILRDFDVGESEINAWKDTLLVNQKNLEILISFLQDPASTDKKLFEEIVSSRFPTRLWAPSSGAFTSIRNNGQLGLISDSSLQSEIIDYFDIAQQYILERRFDYSDLRDQFLEILKRDTEPFPLPDFANSKGFERKLIIPAQQFPTHPDFMETLALFYQRTTENIQVLDASLFNLNELRMDIESQLEAK